MSPALSASCDCPISPRCDSGATRPYPVLGTPSTSSREDVFLCGPAQSSLPSAVKNCQRSLAAWRRALGGDVYGRTRYGGWRGRFAMATAAPRRFCRCACFCSQNLYVARYGLHLRFRDEHQLRRDYGPVRVGVGWSGRRQQVQERRGPDIRNGFARVCNPSVHTWPVAAGWQLPSS